MPLGAKFHLSETEAPALFEPCRSKKKMFLTIPGADHNDLFYRGIDEYLQAVRELAYAAAKE